MKCPTCPEATLTMTERQGIEIDYCPQCRGVWLDRGELDKIIERSNTSSSHSSANANNFKKSSDDDYKKDYYKRKKSFLSEIFD
ncbi:MAG: zf-TFIIB domain-containing protein [Bdellovibrionota bacterium]